MKPVKLIIIMVLGVILSGCATVDTASRNSPFEHTADAQVSLAPAAGAAPSVRVEEIKVSVPSTLIVSELNSYYPPGDIVWRGDPHGDRYEQVKAIFEDGLARGTADLKGDVPVILDVEVERFHSVTEKTRYSIGGVHSIRFKLAIRDANTGELLREPSVVKADLNAYGGQRAIEAEQQGQTQKVRVTDHLSNVIATELRAPGTYKPRGFGFLLAAQ